MLVKCIKILTRQNIYEVEPKTYKYTEFVKRSGKISGKKTERKTK